MKISLAGDVGGLGLSTVNRIGMETPFKPKRRRSLKSGIFSLKRAMPAVSLMVSVDEYILSLADAHPTTASRAKTNPIAIVIAFSLFISSSFHLLNFYSDIKLPIFDRFLVYKMFLIIER
jgi:hypothetical protein